MPFIVFSTFYLQIYNRTQYNSQEALLMLTEAMPSAQLAQDCYAATQVGLDEDRTRTATERKTNALTTRPPHIDQFLCVVVWFYMICEVQQLFI